MHGKTRKIVSLMAAIALLVTCTISGLVLPVAAEDPAAVENLVPNGDFEGGAAAPWTGVNELITVEDGVGFGGSKGLQFAAGDATDIYLKSFTPTLEANSVYELTFLAKGPTVRTSLYKNTDVTMATVYAEFLPSQWTVYRAIIRTGTNPSIDANWGMYFRRDNSAEEPTYIDNVVMKKWDGNVICGGEFDVVPCHFARPHFANGAATIETEADGNNAMFIPASTSALGDKFLMRLWDAIEASTDYVLSMDVKGDPINVYVYGGGGATGGVTGVWNVTAQSDEYQHYTYEFTTTDKLNVEYLINITRNTAATLNTATGTYIDNVMLVKKVYATDITLNQSAADLLVGDTLTLTATPAPAGSVFAEKVVWSTTDKAVATVDNGTVTAVGKGTATITATAGALSASCVVTVTKPQATAIALDKAVTLRVGATDTLTVTTVPENAEYDTVVWSTNNPAVATVENGVVTAVKKGTATITAKAGALSASCVVTVSANILDNGDVEQGKTGVWSSTPVTTLEDGNKVLYIAAGTAYDTAYYWNKMATLDWEVGYYLVSYDVKGDAVRFQVANVSNVAATTLDSVSYSVYGDAADRWVRYYAMVQIKDGYSINSDWAFHFKAYNKTRTAQAVDTYIDNVCIEKVDPAAWNIAAEDFDSASLNGIIYQGIATEIGATGGAVITTDPDDANNKVLKIPVDDAATVVRFKFPYPGAGYFDLTGQFRLIIRYKGPFVNATAGNGTYLSNKTTVGEDGWTTFEEVVDLTSDDLNDLQWAFGLRKPTSEPLYIDYIALEQTGPATEITLDKTAVALEKDQTTTLNVAVTPAGAYAANAVWSTTDAAVATVENGVVTAVGGGTATITLTSGSLSASCVVTVTKPQATAIALDKTAVTLMTGKTATLTVTTTPAGAEYADVVWTTNNAAVATVENGVVTAVGVGTATITAKAGTLTATCVVTVDNNLLPLGDFQDASALYNSSALREIYGGGSIVDDPAGTEGNKVFKLPVDFGERYFKWNKLWNAETGTYDKSLEAGKTYTLSFKLYGDAIAMYMNDSYTVLSSNADVKSGSWSKFGNNTEAWREYAVTFTVKEGINFEWSSDLFKAAAGNGAGYCSNVNPSYIDDFRIVEVETATAITLVPDTLDLVVGDTDTLDVSATPNGSFVPAITWTTENASVATVENGVVTAVGAGTTTITATAGTLSASCVVTVTKPQATALNLDKQALTLLMGNTVTLNASFQPADSLHGELVWSVSDDSVITVDQNGKVTAVGPGTATVGVTDGNLSATCGVTVLSDLVIGGDFEASDTEGIGTFANVKGSTAWYIAPGQGVGGGNALAINYQRSDRWLVWPSFQPNTTYAVSFLAKGPEIMFQLYKYSGTSTFETKYTEDYGDGWAYYRVEFTTGDSFGADPSSAGYGFLLNRPATLEDTTAVTYVDNFSIVETDKSDERLPGGDFEVAVPEQLIRYHLNNGFAQVVAETDGNHALYVPELTADPGDYYMFGVKAQPNTEYVFSFKAKGAPIAFYSSFFGWKATQQSDDYVTYAYKLTTGDSVNEHYLINMTRADECKETLNTETGTYIDDISLKPASSDLIAEEMVMPGVSGTVKPGDAVIFGVTVKNEGTVAVEGEFPIEFRVNGTTWYEMTYNASIAPGATVTVLSDKAWTAVEGDYAISVKINSTMAVHDSSLDNNTAGCELHVASAAPVAPDYAQNAGFDNLTFSDDFNSIDTIDMNATGEAGYKWYVRRPYGATTVTGSDLTVADGILTLKLSDPTYNYGIGTIDPRTGNGFSFNQGYMEIRFRIPDSSILGDNEQGIPAIWSLPPEKIMGVSNAWVEMDWMEYWGKGLKYWQYPEGYYTITMHDQALNADGTTAHWYKNSGYRQNGLGDQEWHTMGWLWEEGKITAYLDGTQVMSQAYSADSTGTPTAYAARGTLENGVFTGMNTLMQSLILGGSADSPLEVDYVRIWQKAEAETPYIYADTTTEGGKIDFGETGVMAEAEENTIVSVNAKPTEGYIMKPGSLKYITKEGTEVKILNKSLTDMTFGGGDGYSFEFKAPADIAKVTAEFIPTTSQTFAIDTVGTALRVAQGGVGYDGIRFLTRMNLATTFDPTTNALMVTYEGVNYEVIELGSLLKRAENANELTMENFENSTTGINRMWKSKAYKKGGGMSLVDYTDSYIDFTVVMTKGASISSETFNARQYTARGYIILQDENGTQKTVLCDTQLTNSVNGASSAL